MFYNNKLFIFQYIINCFSCFVLSWTLSRRLKMCDTWSPKDNYILISLLVSHQHFNKSPLSSTPRFFQDKKPIIAWHIFLLCFFWGEREKDSLRKLVTAPWFAQQLKTVHLWIEKHSKRDNWRVLLASIISLWFVSLLLKISPRDTPVIISSASLFQGSLSCIQKAQNDFKAKRFLNAPKAKIYLKVKWCASYLFITWLHIWHRSDGRKDLAVGSF